MEKLTVVCCVLLLVGAVTALPGASWRRAAEESSPDRDVEEVMPVRGGGSRGASDQAGHDVRGGDSAGSDESPEVLPFGIGIGLRGGLGGLGGFGGFGGLGGFGGRPVLAIRPIALSPRDSTEDSGEDMPSGPSGLGGGFVHPYFVDPMSNFMAQMAEMMAAMRRRMDQVMHRLPSEDSDISKLGNTTSTTKVVNGHVITVNETVIAGEGDGPELHVRVVDVHPSESPEEATATGATGADGKVTADDEKADKDVEPLSEGNDSNDSNEVTRRPNRADNEIPMKPVKRSTRSARSSRRAVAAAPRGDMAADTADEGDDDDDVQQYHMPVFPAEQDTQQSQVPVFGMQQQQVPVFDMQQAQVPVFDMQQQPLQAGQMRMLPAGGNQVDVFDKPSGGRNGDLSRDTLVNVLLEQQHQRAGLIMVDPDAELMDVRDGKVVRVYDNPNARQARRTAPRSQSSGSSW